MTGDNVNYGREPELTPSSLLSRLKANDQAAWQRFVRLYSPVVYRWCRLAGLQEADAADVGQGVFQAVSRAIANFHHDRPGDTLYGWLRVITRNKLRDFARSRQGELTAAGGSEAQALLLQVPEDSAPEDPSSTQEDELLIYRRAAELVLADCEEKTRQAFWRVVMEKQPAAEVARDLGLTVNAIYLAKSRILRRLREEFADILDI